MTKANDRPALTQSEMFKKTLFEESLEKTLANITRLEAKLDVARALVNNLKAAIAAD